MGKILTLFTKFFTFILYLKLRVDSQMTNEELYQEYGYNAFDKGFFQEWRMETSNILTKDPKADRVDVSRMVYERLHQQKLAEKRAQERLSK